MSVERERDAMNLADAITNSFRRVFAKTEPDYTRAFLPAALEVVDTPPSPTGRLLGLIIIVLFVIALAWSFFGRVDIMATAPGRLMPVGDTKVIQSLDPGIVRAIHVQNGQRVKAGDLLIELDPTQTQADQSKSAQDLVHAKLDVARLIALKAAIEGGGAPRFVPPADTPAELQQEARAAMQAQWDQQVAKVAELSQQISKQDAEAAEVKAEIAKTTAAIPLLSAKEKIHHDLNAQGYGTTLAYLDAQNQASDARHELGVEQERLVQATDARTALMRQRDGARSQFAADILADLRKAQESAGEMTQDLVKAEDKQSARVIRSPIDGVVDQLTVHTIGGVVTPAEHLMIVVPENQDLMIEAQLANHDVGFVHAGQIAKVKIETFNFTRYGLIDGRVVNISRDVINPQDQATGALPSAASAANRAPQPSYIARILLEKNSIRVDGRDAALQPGMTVTAEIRTGSRTLLDYLLSPIAKHTQESLHER